MDELDFSSIFNTIRFDYFYFNGARSIHPLTFLAIVDMNYFISTPIDLVLF